MENKNYKKLKIVSIFGTRPEIIRLSRVLLKLDEYTNHVMIHTGQSYDYEMNKIFFENLGLRKPDHFLEVKADTLGEQIANIIQKSEKVLLREKPDAILILGDTNSTLSAIVAKRMKIPIFHMEAGNRSFDDNVPEEINRRIVDHISDINLPYSENARQYLLREGIHPNTIFVTGTPLTEVFEAYKDGVDNSKILDELKLFSKKYFLATIHREENVDIKESFIELIESLNAVAKEYGMPIIMSTHPRTQKRIKEYGIKADPLINFHKPFGYFDFNRLQREAFCVLSDSGSIHEESAVMDFPAIQMRISSERQEAFDEGVSILSGRNKDAVLRSLNLIIQERAKGIKMNVPRNYRDINVSSKVLRHITGLTDILNRRGK